MGLATLTSAGAGPAVPRGAGRAARGGRGKRGGGRDTQGEEEDRRLKDDLFALSSEHDGAGLAGGRAGGEAEAGGEGAEGVLTRRGRKKQRREAEEQMVYSNLELEMNL